MGIFAILTTGFSQIDIGCFQWLFPRIKKKSPRKSNFSEFFVIPTKECHNFRIAVINLNGIKICSAESLQCAGVITPCFVQLLKLPSLYYIHNSFVYIWQEHRYQIENIHIFYQLILHKSYIKTCQLGIPTLDEVDFPTFLRQTPVTRQM